VKCQRTGYENIKTQARPDTSKDKETTINSAMKQNTKHARNSERLLLIDGKHTYSGKSYSCREDEATRTTGIYRDTDGRAGKGKQTESQAKIEYVIFFFP